MKIIVVFLYLIIPSVLVSLQNHINLHVGNSGIIYVILLYLITLVGIFIFFKYKLPGFWALILGLLISPLYTAIFEYQRRLRLPPELRDFGFPYVGTILSVFYYVIPFALLSGIIYIIFEIKTSNTQD